jgi:spore maturation protein SpmA
MNVIFFIIVLIAFVSAGWRQISWMPGDGDLSPMESLSSSMVESAAGSVELALGLVGVMTLFLGLMKVAEAGGMLTILARLIRPLMIRLFPNVPPEHPAMGSMILNMSANALGLGNAATPFGIRAMQELDKLNSRHGTATDSMVLFLAINTSNVTILPTGVIALRAAAGSIDPAGILPTTLFATMFSTLVAILAAKMYGRVFMIKRTRPVEIEGESNGFTLSVKEETANESSTGYPVWVSWIAVCALMSIIPLTVFFGKSISPWIIPGLMLGFLAFGIVRRVRVYEIFVEGAKEGFQVAIRIIPYLVAILVAVGMFRASGAMERQWSIYSQTGQVRWDCLPKPCPWRYSALCRDPVHMGSWPLSLMIPLLAPTVIPAIWSQHSRGPQKPLFMCWRYISGQFKCGEYAMPWQRH